MKTIALLSIILVGIIGCTLSPEEERIAKQVAQWTFNGQNTISVSNSMPVVPMPVVDDNTPIPPPVTPIVSGAPIELGAWGGRPCIALDSRGGVHIVADGGGGPTLAFWDIVEGKVTGGTIAAREFNILTKQFFNPSQVILPDGTQLLTAWWFAFEVEAGCLPYILWRTPGMPWKALLCDPSPVDWEPSKLCQIEGGARFFGFNNDYRDVAMINGDLSITKSGNYGSGGGGEKEARWTQASIMHVANAGCKKTGGAWYRNNLTCDKRIMWAQYSAYPAMGNDDTGHPGVCGDAVSNGIGYMVASWNQGLVYNVWDGKKLLFSSTDLPVLDKGGWSGMVKYPLAMAASPTGGAYVLWTNGNKLYLRHIGPSGAITNCAVISGAIGALCVGADGTVHMAYNAGGKMWYKTWRPY